MRNGMNREVDLAFIKIHILHHAAEGEVYGLGLIEELGRHGYTLGPGTLYPILAKMKDRGLLRCNNRIVGHKQRKYYRITPVGQKLLDATKDKIRELYEEVTS
jgi:DNA-binding PadR family transcriptional regulator